MEVRKAAHPGTYIPFVAQAGSDRSWKPAHRTRRRVPGPVLAAPAVAQPAAVGADPGTRLPQPPRAEGHLPRRARGRRRRRHAAARGPRPAAVPRRALGRRHRTAAAEPLAYRAPHRRRRRAADREVRAHGRQPWVAEHTEIYIRDNLGIELTRNSLNG